MKRLILSFLVVSVLLLAACTAPTVTQTVTVTSTAAPDDTPIVTVTATTTSTVTVTATQTATTTPPSVVEQAGRLPTCEVGDKWVWSYVMDETTYTLTEEVIGEEMVEGRACYVLDMVFDSVMSSTHDGVVYTTTGMKYWADKATGLLGVKMETTTTYNGTAFTSTETYSYDPWTSLFPLEVGKEVETEKTTTHYYDGEQYGETEVATEKYKVVSKEDVTVTAGTFSCWKITYYDSALDTIQTMWWSDEAKTMVKSTDEDGKTMMDLQSFTTAPSTAPTLDQSQTSTPGNTGLEGDWWLSQGFVPSMPILTSVEVYIGSVHANLNEPLTLQIRGDSNGLPSSSVLASTSVTISQAAWGWITFDIPDLAVNPGTRYHLVLSSASNYHTGLDSTNPYPSGCMGYSTDAGKTWKMLNDNPNYDMAFKIHGSVLPTTTPPTTTPTLDQSQTSTPGNTGLEGDWWLSQGFVPSMPLVTAVEVYIGSVHANLNEPLTLQIRGDSNELPSSSVLASTSVTISQAAWGWITFDIPDLAVNPGTRYHLVLSSASNYHVGLDSTNPYPGGHMGYSTDAGITWKMDSPNYDIAFKIYGSGLSTTTPPTFDITGTWSGNWWRSDGKEEGTLIATVILSGSTLTGDMTVTSTTHLYSYDATISGTVEGSEVVFGMAISSNGETVTIDYEGTISEDGNQMSGTYYISTGYTGTWIVTRE